VDLRKNPDAELYTGLKERKRDACLFLNAFTEERLYALLLHLALKKESCNLGQQQLKRMAEYLAQYLNNRKLRMQGTLSRSGNGPLSAIISFNPLYREVYDALLDDQNAWDSLVRESEHVAAAENIQQYLALTDCPYVNVQEIAVCVERDQNGYAGKCIQLQIPEEMCGCTVGEMPAEKMLADIQQRCRSPRCAAENDQVVAAIVTFLDQFGRAKRSRDTQCALWALYAIHFCVQWVNLSPGSKEVDSVLKVVELFNTHLALSEAYFRYKKGRRVEGNGYAAIFQAKDEAYWNKVQGALTMSETGIIGTIQNIYYSGVDLNSVNELVAEMKTSVEELARDMSPQDADMSSDADLPKDERPEREDKSDDFLYDQYIDQLKSITPPEI
jgi:hypothetical protein